MPVRLVRVGSDGAAADGSSGGRFDAPHPRQRRRLHMPLLSPLLLWCLSLLLSLSLPRAAAQSRVHSAESGGFDWRDARTPFTLLLWLLLTPLYACTLVALVRARALYPIAGRGVAYLIAQNVWLLVGTTAMTLTQMAHGRGVPCGLEFALLLTVWAPHAFIYMIRGICLVFRLEIQNFLAELQWREMQQERHELKAEVAQAALLETEAAAAKAAAIAESARKAPPARSAKVVQWTPTNTFDAVVPAESQKPVPLSDAERAEHVVNQTATLWAVFESASLVLSPRESGGRLAPETGGRLPAAPAASAAVGDVPDGRGGFVSLDCLPGYSFVTNRQYSEPSFLLRMAGFVTVLIGAVVVAFGLADPDPSLTDADFHRRGLLDDDQSYPSTSQLSPSQFLIAAPCLLHSIKIMVLRGLLVGFVMPTVLCIYWRLRDNKRREQARDEAWRAWLEEGEQAQGRPTTGVIVVDPAAPDSAPVTPASPCVPPTTLDEKARMRSPSTATRPVSASLNPALRLPTFKHAATQSNKKRGRGVRSAAVADGTGSVVCSSQAAPVRGGQTSDSELVKRELLVVMVASGANMVLYVLFAAFADAWLQLPSLLTMFAMWTVSIVHPLWISRETTRRHRNFLKQNRDSVMMVGGVGCGAGGGGGAGVGADGSAAPLKLAHHAPLFDLEFVLKDRSTFPLFLQFLQKEYSSENALFCKEASQFIARMRLLEQAIPSWPQNAEMDEADRAAGLLEEIEGEGAEEEGDEEQARLQRAIVDSEDGAEGHGALAMQPLVRVQTSHGIKLVAASPPTVVSTAASSPTNATAPAVVSPDSSSSPSAGTRRTQPKPAPILIGSGGGGSPLMKQRNTAHERALSAVLGVGTPNSGLSTPPTRSQPLGLRRAIAAQTNSPSTRSLPPPPPTLVVPAAPPAPAPTQQQQMNDMLVDAGLMSPDDMLQSQPGVDDMFLPPSMAAQRRVGGNVAPSANSRSASAQGTNSPNDVNAHPHNNHSASSSGNSVQTRLTLPLQGRSIEPHHTAALHGLTLRSTDLVVLSSRAGSNNSPEAVSHAVLTTIEPTQQQGSQRSTSRPGVNANGSQNHSSQRAHSRVGGGGYVEAGASPGASSRRLQSQDGSVTLKTSPPHAHRQLGSAVRPSNRSHTMSPPTSRLTPPPAGRVTSMPQEASLTIATAPRAVPSPPPFVPRHLEPIRDERLLSLTPMELRILHEEAARLRFWCLQLWENYLRRHSIYEVNVPTQLSAAVQSQMAQVEAYHPTPLRSDGSVADELMECTLPTPPPFPLSALYAPTRASIFDLMQRDSFRRFVLTAEFRQLLADADAAELARAERQLPLQQEMRQVADRALSTMQASTLRLQQHRQSKLLNPRPGSSSASFVSATAAAFAAPTTPRSPVAVRTSPLLQMQPRLSPAGTAQALRAAPGAMMLPASALASTSRDPSDGTDTPVATVRISLPLPS